jgi:RNA polymerase sigma factor (sigma-70 family)
MTEHDHDLLRRYNDDHSETAFADLVHGYLNLVYAAALRQVGGDSQLAQDVAQSVFIDFARKARTLADHGSLAGWLYTSTRFAAAKAVRSEQRRRWREERASAMYEPGSAAESDLTWDQLRPVLDEAMHDLDETQREAVLLRYFQGRDFGAVGAALRISDEAARKRVERALDKLRDALAQRGITSTGGALAALLAASTGTVVPGGLAMTITSAVFQSAAVGGATVNLITLGKMKAIIGAILITGMSVPLLVQHRTNSRLVLENVQLRDQAAQAAALAAEIPGQKNNPLDPNELAAARTEHAELLRLRSEVGQLHQQLLSRARDNAERATTPAPVQPAQDTVDPVEEELAKNVDTCLKQLGLAARIFATDHGDKPPTTFEEIKSELPAQLPGDLSLDQFEFVQHQRTVSLTDHDLILFRERQARRLSDGKWVKGYALMSGATTSHVSDDGNFEAWENEHTAQVRGK